MRLRHKKNAEADIFNSPLVINVGANPDSVGANANTVVAKFTSPITSETIFGSKNPLHLELGMGKGKFIIELSKQNPDTNYIGIEKSATIILKAIDNYIGASLNHMGELREPLNRRGELCEPSSKYNNLRFMCTNIETLETIFPPHSIDKIYLNFSDPWPKKRHESRRLTHNNFLSMYEKILKPNSFLEFKTDNIGLFEFSLKEIKNSNFKLLEYTYDLHNDESLNINNIMTEYESKFSKLGNKICKLIAKI